MSLTILIPAAGNGQRFLDAGYGPKALVPVVGKPMIQRVMENLTPADGDHQFILISRLDFELTDPLLGLTDLNVRLTAPTEGAVDTILSVRDQINDGPLLVGNCDQLIAFSPDAFMLSAAGRDGALVTFRSDRPHHSYVKIDDDGLISDIAEKVVISNQAVTGVYFFQNGKDFIAHCDAVVDANDRYNSEFYVSSVIARMIENGRRFVTYDASSAMLGTPSELQLFEMAVEVAKAAVL